MGSNLREYNSRKSEIWGLKTVGYVSITVH